MTALTRQGPAPAGRPYVWSASHNAATKAQNTAGVNLELEVTNAAIWGPPAQAVDLAAEIRAAEVVDQWCSAVLQASAEVAHWVDDTPGALALAIHDHLVDTGTHRPGDFWQLALADVDNDRLSALAFLLSRLDEEAHRRKVLARLVALADSAEHPGGPERVAKLLGMAS